MKRNILFIFASVLILALLLAACGSKTITSSSDSTTGITNIDTETKLLVGTLKLDGTDQEVDADEAAKLLPLWQMYKSLNASDTAAQEEIDAVIKQIQDTMTSDQLNAIDAMQLTPQDAMTVMQDLGLAMAPGGNGTSATPDFSSMPQDFQGGQPPSGSQSGNAPSGGVPSGGAPSGDGQPPADFSGGSAPSGGTDLGMGQDLTQGQSATPQAWQTGRTGGNSPFTSQLVDALIDYLQAKTQQ
jgi:hypothetical protein